MSFKYLKSKLWDAPEIAIRDITADVWSFHGYTTDTNSESKHQGVDVIATQAHPYQRKEVIQIDHSSNDPVESSLIQQSSALPRQEEADDVILVTTGSLTENAVTLAADLEVHVVDTDQLCSTIHAADLYSTVAEYVQINDSRKQRIHLETVTDRIVANTPIDSERAVYEELRAFFQNHPSAPRIEEQPTLNAFSDVNSQDWQHSTTVRWPSQPKPEAEAVADHLIEELSKQDVPAIEPPVLASAISLGLNENVGKPLTEASASELAEWYIRDFDRSQVPLAVEDHGLAVDIAEDVIITDESVAGNKLRVASELNQRYDEMYDSSE